MGNKLGIVGGLGPETTADFYLRLVKYCRSHKTAYPRVIIRNAAISFADEKAGICGGDSEPVIQEIISCLRDLQAAGCNAACIPCNTVHLWLDRFRSAVPQLELLPITTAVGRGLQTVGARNALILASRSTVRDGLYQATLSRFGIQYLLPSEEEQARIDAIILRINAGKTDRQDADWLANYAAGKTGGDRQTWILLACTDLYQIVPDCNAIPGWIDSTQCLVDSALEFLDS